MHDELQIGDHIDLSAPVGEFTVTNVSSPQLFIGSGIGVTPLIPMFNEVAMAGSEAHFIQNINDNSGIPFKEKLATIDNAHSNVKYVLHNKDIEGYITSDYLKQYITPDTEVYVCGGVNFLKSIMTLFKEMEIDASQIHFESFIPKLSVGV